MEIKLFLTIEKSTPLPLNNNYLIQSMIYHLLKENSDVSTYIHDTGYQYLERKYKMFTFSSIIGRYHISGKEIVFEDKIILKIRTIDQNIYQQLILSLSTREHIFIGPLRCRISKVEYANRKLTRQSYKIRMISPIVVHSTDNGKTYFYNPLEEEFEKRLNDNVKRKYQAYYGRPLVEDFSIKCLNFSSKLKLVTRYKDFYITAWKGDYQLQGSSELLNFIYQVGLGEKNAMGFGMFDIERK